MKINLKSKPATATPGPWTVGVYVENDYEPAYFPVERDERDASGFVKDVCPLIAKVTYGANVEEKLANAILLASAHGLMEAARDAADCLDAVAGDMPPTKATRSIVARIRATITTATGNE